ncbi:probable LRR receptor-like serine/threonine-protein kinase At3g47570 [Prosopis cineraria]|uniref:probable LRR receptor-like serine/threonine-protein kinase At3g47570 n=1 Tax=Prosopis cineraria TaxID=364024 RepID=UPI002410AB64|nr:probable LRR receptor-like serine/threonine-protein kinase At3g47570 [Prosopis cineraria]
MEMKRFEDVEVKGGTRLSFLDHNLLIVKLVETKRDIPSSIEDLTMLKVLHLSQNNLEGNLPSDFGCGLPNLEELYVWSNKLFGIMPDTISNASKLIILALTENNFKGVLPSTLGDLRYLKKLGIEGNSFTTSDASNSKTNLITSLTNCRHLEFLFLSANPFFIKLPKSIGNFSDSLQELDIVSCGINGNIPSEIGNLTNLIKLSLDENVLNGPIPITISNLQALQYLSLEGNDLHGLIVHDLCEIKPLGYLHLSQNKFSGAMTPCLGNLSSLRELHLGSNKLALEIPSSFWNLKDILEVNLSSNHFVGNLSSRVENLKALSLLDLSQNHISSNIPTTMGSLQNLQILSLAHNKLEGSIPRSLGNLLNLQNLDLSQNNLSGKIPKSLELLIDLKYVNLSFNKLQGEIPDGGVFKNLTPESFMMNLALCGIILLRLKRQNSRCLAERDLSTLGMPRRISYFEILEATNGFDESNILGRGSYGIVFKGKLSSGMVVAVKIFNFDSQVMVASFEKECDILRNVRHRNLVKHLLWSISILELDDEMIAHVSDFGISKLLNEGESKTYTETIPTIGYMAPEYGSSGVVSTKIDVYSYGIMLLEVFTRKRPTEDIFVSALSLKSWVSESMPHAIIQVMDSNLLQGVHEHHKNNILTSTFSILELALNCCTDLPEARGNMIDVAASLNKIKAMFLHKRHV